MNRIILIVAAISLVSCASVPKTVTRLTVLEEKCFDVDGTDSVQICGLLMSHNPDCMYLKTVEGEQEGKPILVEGFLCPKQ